MPNHAFGTFVKIVLSFNSLIKHLSKQYRILYQQINSCGLYMLAECFLMLQFPYKPCCVEGGRQQGCPSCEYNLYLVGHLLKTTKWKLYKIQAYIWYVYVMLFTISDILDGTPLQSSNNILCVVVAFSWAFNRYPLYNITKTYCFFDWSCALSRWLKLPSSTSGNFDITIKSEKRLFVVDQSEKCCTCKVIYF